VAVHVRALCNAAVAATTIHRHYISRSVPFLFIEMWCDDAYQCFQTVPSLSIFALIISTLIKRANHHNRKQSSMLPTLLLKRPSNLLYISEGNAHAVFQFKDGNVLRVPKKYRSHTEAVIAQRFTLHVWSKLLGQQYVIVPRPCILPSNSINVINDVLSSSKRSSGRTNIVGNQGENGSCELNSTTAEIVQSALSLPIVSSTTTTTSPTATVIPDRPCWSIEIKPKSGCLPSSKNIPEKSPKLVYSRYYMHQYLKLKQKKISNVSQYSPIDFFSNNERKVKNALNNMWLAPQNNMQLFLNGVKQDITKSTPKKDLLLNIATNIILNENQLINSVLKIQLMDVLDFEKESWNDYMNASSSCKVQETSTLSIYKTYVNGRTMTNIQKFLLARTMMDCSFVLSFSPLCKNGNEVLSESSLQTVNECGILKIVSDKSTEEYKWYQYRIVVVDVDVKSISKLNQWMKLDQNIVQHFLQCSKHT
jgi:inositol-pentakisphosphate 2-kinase